ncbi:hypothetical protein L484_019901 [Morus notabilis]|uniref:Uncharacterized protein n=1 Tax=Morus notabilis TaxID=981085 RepID=W9SHW8_9ROSA|nr:uncharacterized protein LOC21402818 [Morus notabilis]EXC32787.1 hypothetical protein L484_019901 [Morus notabilis]
MGIKEWCNCSLGDHRAIVLGKSYDVSTQHGWRSFWRKIKTMENKNKKKKMVMIKNKLYSSSSVRLQPSYDPTTYSKNFDQGMGWEEPDYLSRSFSARFADPSRIFPKNIVLLD